MTQDQVVEILKLGHLMETALIVIGCAVISISMSMLVLIFRNRK
jgi:hypothetical protein